MCFKKKREDRELSELKQQVADRDKYFAELIPTLNYPEKVKMALDVAKNSVCCGPVLQMVKEIEVMLLEREVALLEDARKMFGLNERYEHVDESEIW